MTDNARVEAGTTGPALTGSHDEALLQALRNLWPILSPTGRQQAIDTVTTIRGSHERHRMDQPGRVLRRPTP